MKPTGVFLICMLALFAIVVSARHIEINDGLDQRDYRGKRDNLKHERFKRQYHGRNCGYGVGGVPDYLTGGGYDDGFDRACFLHDQCYDAAGDLTWKKLWCNAKVVGRLASVYAAHLEPSSMNIGKREFRFNHGTWNNGIPPYGERFKNANRAMGNIMKGVTNEHVPLQDWINKQKTRWTRIINNQKTIWTKNQRD